MRRVGQRLRCKAVDFCCFFALHLRQQLKIDRAQALEPKLRICTAWFDNLLIDTKRHVWPTSMRSHARKGMGRKTRLAWRFVLYKIPRWPYKGRLCFP